MKKNCKRPEGGLLQSKEWASVLRAEGKNVIEVHDDNRALFGVEQMLSIVGKYIYFPRISQVTDELINKMIRLKCGWIRTDICSDKDLKMLYTSGKKIVKAPHNTQPKENLIIDIIKDEDELLAQMKSKTRYNIKLAQKKNVHVFMSKDKKYIDALYDLIGQTSRRKSVAFHDKFHYESIINELPEKMIELYIAEYDDDIVAINLVSYCNSTATYLHGATADVHRSVMAPFLLQWKIIQDAKKRGCDWYDFGGVFSGSKNKGKQGITRFKKGFAPKEEFFVTEGSYDIILSPIKYKIYQIIQKIKNIT